MKTMVQKAGIQNDNSSRHLTSLKYDEHIKFWKFYKLSFEFSCCCAILNINFFTHFIAPFVTLRNTTQKNLSTYEINKLQHAYGKCFVFIHSLIRIRKVNLWIKIICSHFPRSNLYVKFLRLECTKILVNAFMTSYLDYGNSLLYGFPYNQLHKLQRVLNAAARLTCICNLSRFDPTCLTPSLYFLYWLPIIYMYRIH